MRKRNLFLTTGACLATLTLTLTASTASADPSGAPPFRALAGVGGETTQHVMNALSNIIMIPPA